MDIKSMVNEYFEWLKQNYRTEKVNDFYIVHTPFTLSNFDLIDILVFEKGKKLMLSNDGEILNNLFISGINFKTSKKRKNMLESFLYTYGLEINENEEIIKYTDSFRFAQDKHMFIQGLLAIDDMFLTASNRTKSFFLEDVKNFFDKEKIYASPNINIKGKSKMEHHFDFLLNRNEKHNERLIKVINNLNNLRDLKAILYSFKDIEDGKRETDNIIIYNDTAKTNNESVEALQYENISLFPWSENTKWSKELKT